MTTPAPISWRTVRQHEERLDGLEAELPETVDPRLDALEAGATAEAAARAAADTAEANTRAAADTALDARLDVLEAWIPGTELGYAEITADFTTTNTSNTNTTDGPGAGGVIPSFSVGPIVGKGRPVEIAFDAPQVRHTTASAFVNAYLLVNGAVGYQNTLAGSPATNIGRVLAMRRRMVLTDGVSYTFKVGIQGGVAGTATVDAAADTPVSLAVIAR